MDQCQMMAGTLNESHQFRGGNLADIVTMTFDLERVVARA